MAINQKLGTELSDLGVTGSWKLTEKQQKFALTYIKTGGDRKKAIKQAGYKTNPKNYDIHACKILKDPVLRNYINKMRAEMEEQFKIDAAWVLKKHHKVVVDFIPDEDKCNPMEASVAQKSLDGICKIQGLYAAEKRELKVEGTDPDIEQAKEIARENAKEY